MNTTTTNTATDLVTFFASKIAQCESIMDDHRAAGELGKMLEASGELDYYQRRMNEALAATVALAA
jgi:hypothetical protein